MSCNFVVIHFCMYIQDLSVRYSSTPKHLKYDELKAWMEGQFSLLTSMIAKNTEAIDTLKGLLLRKKNKMVKQNTLIQHSLIIDLAMKCLS